MVRNAGQRISLHFPFFMYLWHAIKPGCLDREITPCLPTNKPPALVSSPLFIIHNLLWCQGQSDCIVMVKGKIRRPRTFHKDWKSRNQTNKNVKSDGLDCNQQPQKIWWGWKKLVKASQLLHGLPRNKAKHTTSTFSWCQHWFIYFIICFFFFFFLNFGFERPFIVWKKTTSYVYPYVWKRFIIQIFKNEITNWWIKQN